MGKINSQTEKDNFEVSIYSQSGHRLTADEPESIGGMNKGMSPDDLIIAALAACTSATVKMYAQRKGWELQEVKTTIEIHREKPQDLPTIKREVVLIGNLDEEQRERIMVIANKCPVHKLLTNPVEIETIEVK